MFVDETYICDIISNVPDLENGEILYFINKLSLRYDRGTFRLEILTIFRVCMSFLGRKVVKRFQIDSNSIYQMVTPPFEFGQSLNLDTKANQKNVQLILFFFS